MRCAVHTALIAFFLNATLVFGAASAGPGDGSGPILQYSRFSDVPASAFTLPDNLEFEGLDGPVDVFCFSEIEFNVIKELEVRYRRGVRVQDFNEEGIVAMIVDNDEIILTVNSFSQIRDKVGTIYDLGLGDSEYIYGFVRGFSLARGCN